MGREAEIDRLGIRERPDKAPFMYQSWLRLLFIHWSLPVGQVRPHVPGGLEIDTYDGAAWIAITPFAVKGLRLTGMPPVPLANNFREINVRTYVHCEGVPGVWFFSLDTDSMMAVLGARSLYHLPYRKAAITMQDDGGAISFRSQRRGAYYDATYEPGDLLGEAAPTSLPFFLVERYCLYSTDGGRLYRARIHHRPWVLRSANITALRSSMIGSHGMPEPEGEPLLHFSERQDVAVWPIEEVGRQA